MSCWDKNEKKNEFLIGGDFNTVLDPVVDKFEGLPGTRKNCREKINSMIDSFDLVNIWRVYHPTERQFTWHSSTRPVIFSRLFFGFQFNS